jgi:LuxR family maltose regulon positive regulatory protein
MAELFSAKFSPPATPPGYIARPQLLERLDCVFLRRLTLVSAPAGAGKTTLASAWAQTARKRGHAVGWCSLEEGDNAPNRFADYLVASLEEGGIQLAPVALTTAGYPTLPEQDNLDFFTSLVYRLGTLDREAFLILDDYHLIHHPDIHRMLGALLDHMPQHLHLILLTRSDPPLELARMRLSDQMDELRMEQLRFSAQEAEHFLQKSAGVRLSESEIILLNTRTDGWIAGLQMAAISLRQTKDASAFISAFAGSHRFVFDYLLEEVLNRQPDEIRQFLLETSVLERLCSSLCDALTGAPGSSRQLLDHLERANLFLIPLDDERCWYRFHHLFADLLKLMLQQKHPGLAQELHQRACRWYEMQGMIPEALHHALEGHEMQLAAQLVSTNLLALIEHSELTSILLRMDAALRQQHLPQPWLSIAHAWALVYTGQMERTEAALANVEKHLDTLLPDERQRINGHIAAVRAYAAWVNGAAQAAVVSAESAARLLPTEEIAVRALNLTTLGNALTQYQPSLHAVQVLEKAVSLARQACQTHVLMPAATALAYAYFNLGKIHKAYAVCQDALENAEAYQHLTGMSLNAAASVYAQLSAICCEWGNARQALHNARKGLALSELWGQTDTILLCLLHLANGYSLARDFESAYQVMQRARKLAQKVSPWFVLNVDQVKLKICLDEGNIAQALHVAQEPGATSIGSLQARLLVTQNQPEKALSFLEEALYQSQSLPSLETVRLLIVQALAYSMRKEESRAVASLTRALELAEPENLLTTFVREGQPLEKLLQRARLKSVSPEYIHRLVAAFQAHRDLLQATAIESLSDSLIEPLSERELEILNLLNGPLATPEIAGQLFVSVNTVRTHIKNIYSKLSVHGRSAAVARACQLGLVK